MRFIHHRVPFSPQEVESYRQLVFNNLTHGLKYLLDAMTDMDLKLKEENIPHVELIENATDIRDGEPFPSSYLEPLSALWNDPNVRRAWARGNEAALPEKYVLYRLLESQSQIDVAKPFVLLF
jgi:guanine nucleotide-binding protein subunit alpha